MTTVTVKESEPRRSFSETLLADETFPTDSIETAVLKVVRQDPFVSIREIKRELLSQKNPMKAGWWQIFSLLKKNRLLTKKSRFKYVRRYF